MVKKIFWILLKVVVVIALIYSVYYLKKDKVDYYDIPVNSYYTDATYDLESVHRKIAQDQFLEYVNAGDYNSIYNALSSTSREQYINMSDLEEYITTNVFNVGEMDSKEVEFVKLSEDYSEEYTKIRYVLYVGNRDSSEGATKKIISLLEYSPFKYEIEL